MRLGYERLGRVKPFLEKRFHPPQTPPSSSSEMAGVSGSRYKNFWHTQRDGIESGVKNDGVGFQRGCRLEFDALGIVFSCRSVNQRLTYNILWCLMRGFCLLFGWLWVVMVVWGYKCETATRRLWRERGEVESRLWRDGA